MSKRAVIVATTLLWGGCGATPEMTHNPPMPVPEPVIKTNPPDPEPLQGNPPSSWAPFSVLAEKAEWSAYPKSLNPRRDNLTVYRPWTQDLEPHCVIYPDDGQTRPPGMMPPAKDIDCDPVMHDPIWSVCSGGEIRSNDAGTDCGCFQFGNPPPPSMKLSRCPS
jgi:hypothetical protein